MSHKGRCFRDRRRTARRKAEQKQKVNLLILRKRAMGLEGMTTARVLRMSVPGLEQALRYGRPKKVFFNTSDFTAAPTVFSTLGSTRELFSRLNRARG